MAQFPYPKNENAILAAVVAVRLRELERHYPTLRHFAKAAGISIGTLHVLRSGDGNPTTRSLERIASKLGMSIWTLLGVEPVHITTTLSREGLNLTEIRAFIARQREQIVDYCGEELPCQL